MTHRLVAEIDLSAVRHNVGVIREFVGPEVAVMAIVKADGYGHGAVEVAGAALEAGASWLGIATVSEGIELREVFPDASIGHLPPFPPDACDEIVRHRLTPFISDLPGLERLNAAASQQGFVADFHLEVDTGMGRSGATVEQAYEIAQSVQGVQGYLSVQITGIATHFAAAESDPAYTQQQIETFEHALERVGGWHPHGIVHAANSPATLLYPTAHYHMVRPGLLMYGILPSLPPGFTPPPLRPVMTLKTQVALVRTLEAGQSLSYSRTYVLNRRSRIATLPVGYGDGYPRGLSNVGEVLIGGKRAPIMGRVCMDVTLVDVTDIPQAEVGAEAMLIGSQGEEEIRVEELARLLQTTEHEITTRLSPRVRRVYKGSACCVY